MIPDGSFHQFLSDLFNVLTDQVGKHQFPLALPNGTEMTSQVLDEPGGPVFEFTCPGYGHQDWQVLHHGSHLHLVLVEDPTINIILGNVQNQLDLSATQVNIRHGLGRMVFKTFPKQIPIGS